MDALFGDERLARLYRYWWLKRQDRTAPHRTDLNPTEIPDLLPIMHLIDVAWDPLSFRHRLVGTELVEWLERDVTGKPVVEDLYGAAGAEVLRTLGLVATEVRAYRRRARLDWHRRNWLTSESVELPLIDDGGRVAMILRGAVFATAGADIPQRMEFMPLPPPPDV